MIVEFVDEHRTRFGVAPICTVLSEHGLSIAPSTYYARRRLPATAMELADAYAANKLVGLHRANRSVYGVRKLWHAAWRDGVQVGRDQVARPMAIAGIRGVSRGLHRTTTTRREPAAARHPDLVKRG